MQEMIECPACNGMNERAMHYCMHCGEDLAVHREEIHRQPGKTGINLIPCPSCRRTDPLSTHFCVFCGVDIPRMSQSISVSSMNSVESQPVQNAQTTATRSEISTPASFSSVSTSPVNAISIALGILGAILGVALGMQPVLQPLSWPQDGIVVYVKPGFANVVVEDISRKLLVLGKSSKDGYVSFPDLPPAEYIIRISAPGHKTIRLNSPVLENRASVLGFPNAIELPPA
ncbi:MAG: hypothetical protein KIT34_03290 [Cyanobacteria bacterium TGS_CYA1]|nr:hypothetical protein [Cyanobacteria bacterium TGS_CYA1]